MGHRERRSKKIEIKTKQKKQQKTHNLKISILGLFIYFRYIYLCGDGLLHLWEGTGRVGNTYF